MTSSIECKQCGKTLFERHDKHLILRLKIDWLCPSCQKARKYLDEDDS
jgi:rubredoxin